MKKNFFYGLIVLVILIIPLFILGENAYISQHDNLDSEHLYLHLLKANMSLFNYNIYNSIDLLPGEQFYTAYIHSSFNLINLFYLILPSFWAYAVNFATVRLVGFLGAYLLAIRCFDEFDYPVLFALFFATIPLFEIYGISISGIPGLLYVILRSMNGGFRFSYAFYLIFYAFYSHFFIIGFFITGGVFIYGLFKRSKVILIISIALGLLYCVFNLPTLFHIIFGEIELNRSSMNLVSNNWFPDIVFRFFRVLIVGEYHFTQFWFGPILLMITFYSFRYKRYNLAQFIVPIILISFISTLFSTFELRPFGFNMSRINVLNIPLSLILILHVKGVFSKFWRVIFPSIFLFTIGLSLFIEKEFINNIEASFSGFTKPNPVNFNSYESFYCPENVSVLKDELESLNYNRVVSVGFHPAILQYSGIKTADVYLNIYPLSYKERFGKFISPELNKSNTLSEYYWSWGNRVYFFASDLEQTCSVNCNQNTSITTINSLDYNSFAAHDLSITHIISSVQINNPIDMGLEYLFDIEADSSNSCQYSFFIYRVNYP